MLQFNKNWDNYSMFAADFETTKSTKRAFSDKELLADNKSLAEAPNMLPDEESKVFLCGLQNCRTSEYTLSYEDLDDLFYNIWNQTKLEKKKFACVWFHNMKFDCSFIKKYLIKNGYTQTLAVGEWGQSIINYKEFTLLEGGGKMYSLKVRYNGKIIFFFDTLKLFPACLDSLGKDILGIKKLKNTVDYSKFKLDKSHNYPKEWLTYLKRDVDILAGVIVKMFNEEKKISMKKFTIGSVAYSYVNKKVHEVWGTPDTFIKRHNQFTVKEYWFYYKWLHGGFCAPSFDAWGKWDEGKFIVLDRNSMHPASMCQPLPILPMEKKINPNWKTYCGFLKIHIKKAEIKAKYGCFACIWKPFEYNEETHKKTYFFTEYDTNYQYVQSVEDKIYYVTDIELKCWKQFYDIDYEVLDGWYFETKPFLRRTIKQLYKAKKQATLEGNATRRMISKLVLNNIFGKFCTKPDRPQVFYGKKESIDENKYIIIGEKKDTIEAWTIQKKPNPEAEAKVVVVGAYITALSRVSLFNKIKQVIDKGNIWKYSDTDSLVIKVINEMSDKELDVGDELGQWDYEEQKIYKLDNQGHFLLTENDERILERKQKDFDFFCTLAPKQYRCCVKGYKYPSKQACAGVKREDIEIIPNKDYNYDLEGLVKNTLKNSEYGVEIIESPFNFLKWKYNPETNTGYHNPVVPKGVL